LTSVGGTFQGDAAGDQARLKPTLDSFFKPTKPSSIKANARQKKTGSLLKNNRSGTVGPGDGAASLS